MNKQSEVTIMIRARDMASRVFNSIGASLGGVKRAVFSLQGVIGAASAALIGAGLTAFLVSVNREYGKLLTQLQTFQGSSAGARVVFDELADFAAKTPFQIGELVEAFIKLRSAGINPSMETLRLFGDHTAAFGGRIVDFADAVRAATTGEMERLKQFGVVARLQGEELRVSFNGVTKVIGRDAASIVGYLEELSRVNFTGGMERQSKTLDGALSNLQDAVESLARKIGDAGLTQVFIDMARAMTGWTEALGKNDGPLRAWIGYIRDTFGIAARSIELLTDKIDSMAARSAFRIAQLRYYMPHAGDEENARRRGDMEQARKDLERAEAAERDASTRRGQAISDRDNNSARNRLGSMEQQQIKAYEAIIAGGGNLTVAQAQHYLKLTKPSGGMVTTTTASSENTGPKKKEAKAKKTKTELETRVESMLDSADLAVEASELNFGKQLDQLLRLQEAQAGLNLLMGDGNLTLEQRLDLEKKRQDVLGQLNKKFPGAGAKTGVAEDVAKTAATMGATTIADIGETFKNGLPAQNTLDAISKAMKAAVGEGQTLNQIIADMTTNTFQAFGSAVQSAFAALVDGSASAGQAFASAMLGALGAVAGGFGQFFMARATGELAAGIGALSNPITAPKAAGHFASAAKWSAGAFAMFAIAGSMGGAASRVGGGGRSGAASRDTDALKDQKGDANIIIEGGLLDMNDPRTEASFARAIESLTGRRVVVTTRRK